MIEKKTVSDWKKAFLIVVLWFPWEILSLGILKDTFNSITIEHITRAGIQHNKRWNAIDLKLIVELSLQVLLIEVNSQPRHGSIVLIECLLTRIPTHEHNLKVESLAMTRVELGQLWREVTTWRTP